MRRSKLTHLFAVGALGLSAAGSAQGGTLSIELDTSQRQDVVKDLFGVNRKPAFILSKTGSTIADATSLYAAFGVTQVRLHDSDLDLCVIYTAASKIDTSASPVQAVSGCERTSTRGLPTLTWTPLSSADADLDNPAHYDFSAADATLLATAATGARIYLRLGESFNGPNNTGDPVAWAKVATQIYRHVTGAFKPTAGIAIDPLYVEVHNEPDGGFWRGTSADFYTLFRETVDRVRAAATAAGKTVRIGGPGFTHSILTSSKAPANPAYGFIDAVGAERLDFYSAHYYDACADATLTSSGTFLRSLRSLVDTQGGTGKPVHITEWNIGLGHDCGHAFYASQRTQSFVSGVLTLMQDPALNIEAAHFYAGVPIMALFDFASASNKVRINPAAWAFWAHTSLRGASRVAAQVCQDGTCAAGYAADTLPLQVLAARSGTGHALIVTNDGSSARSYTLNVGGIADRTVDVSIYTPPAGTAELAASGSPVTADAAALQALLASVSEVRRPAQAVASGKISLELSIPAQTLQLIQIKPTTPTLTTQADCLFDWGERTYPAYLSPQGAASQASGNVYYRQYLTTQTYLGVTLDPAVLYFWNPALSSTPTALGELGSWLASSRCN